MDSGKNYLKQTVIGTALVIAVLLALRLIPEFDIGSFHFKRIDMLADILVKEKPKDITQDTVKVVKPVYVDTCKTGITCIEDYTADSSGMRIFMAALDSSKRREVRIAWFGDSYVEGDILLDPLRDSLQALFGGSGVGFVPITSEVNRFRQTITHEFKNWKTYSIVGDHSDDYPLGPAGHVFVPQDGDEVSYEGIPRRKRLSYFPSEKIYYGQAEGATLRYSTGGEPVEINLKDGNEIQQLVIDSTCRQFSLAVTGGKAVLYGADFESSRGICVDNFSMRGNSGIGLYSVNEKMYRDFDALHHYDLVILSYGLNVASEKAKNYYWYVKGMSKVIAMIKKAFPRSSILMIGCSDRAAKIDGDYQTMPMLKELIDVQRQMAADNQVCFWNIFEAMGGDSTMINWADMPHHPLADKDYTHLTFYGGKKVAEIFIGTLLYEKEKYDRKKKSM
ncbi:MAG TPA: hypothetical protein VG603_03580 [Chitinophagales bacterium]|nr:hypothetical protein [Chitinophagales bacterium]